MYTKLLYTKLLYTKQLYEYTMVRYKTNLTHKYKSCSDDEGEDISPHRLVVGAVAFGEELQIRVQLVLT